MSHPLLRSPEARSLLRMKGALDQGNSGARSQDPGVLEILLTSGFWILNSDTPLLAAG